MSTASDFTLTELVTIVESALTEQQIRQASVNAIVALLSAHTGVHHGVKTAALVRATARGNLDLRALGVPAQSVPPLDKRTVAALVRDQFDTIETVRGFTVTGVRDGHKTPVTADHVRQAIKAAHAVTISAAMAQRVIRALWSDEILRQYANCATTERRDPRAEDAGVESPDGDGDADFEYTRGHADDEAALAQSMRRHPAGRKRGGERR